MLGIPYINAMIIFRTYKSDNKVISHAKQHKATECYSPFMKEGQFSMEKLRSKTIKILLNAFENKMFTEKEKNKILSANPEVLLQMNSIGMTGYDFDETFKVKMSEEAGKPAVVLPIPSKMTTEEEYAMYTRRQSQMFHESLREEIYNERNSLHNFLLKQDFRFSKLSV